MLRFSTTEGGVAKDDFLAFGCRLVLFQVALCYFSDVAELIQSNAAKSVNHESLTIGDQVHLKLILSIKKSVPHAQLVQRPCVLAHLLGNPMHQLNGRFEGLKDGFCRSVEPSSCDFIAALEIKQLFKPLKFVSLERLPSLGEDVFRELDREVFGRLKELD